MAGLERDIISVQSVDAPQVQDAHFLYYVFGGGGGLEGELIAPSFVYRNKDRRVVVPLSYCAFVLLCLIHCS